MERISEVMVELADFSRMTGSDPGNMCIGECNVRVEWKTGGNKEERGSIIKFLIDRLGEENVKKLLMIAKNRTRVSYRIRHDGVSCECTMLAEIIRAMLVLQECRL